jgi:hypothetical protein
VVLSASVLFFFTNFAQPDLWGRMSVGALLAQNGAFPYHDPFNYSVPGQRWIDHEWGAGVLYFWLVQQFGSASLYFLQVFLYGTTLFLALRTFRLAPQSALPSHSTLYLPVFVLAALMMSSLYVLTLWSHDISFLGFALFLWILESVRRGASVWRLAILPLLMLFWVNSHGGFVTGFFLGGLYLLEALLSKDSLRFKALAACGLACAAASLANPYGLDFIRHMIFSWTLERRHVMDWDSVLTVPMAPLQPLYAIAYCLLVTGSVAVHLRAWWQSTPRGFPLHLLLLGLTGVEGLLHYKLVPLFFISLLAVGFHVPSLPGLTPGMSSCWPQALRNRLAVIGGYLLPMGLSLAAGFLLISQGLGSPWGFSVKASETGGLPYPVSAVRFLQASGTTGNLWSTFVWGEFLYWSLYPQMKVSMDGRFEEVYPVRIFEQYLSFFLPPHDIGAASRMDTTHLLIPDSPQYGALHQKLDQDPGWHLIYLDDTARLYARQPGPFHTPTQGPATVTVDEWMGDLTRFKNERERDPGRGDTPGTSPRI